VYARIVDTLECRCDERLKTKAEGSTRLAYSGIIGGLYHLKIETRLMSITVDYESIKRDPQRIPIYECRCDERLQTEAEGSTTLTYTGLCGGLEHLKIEMRLIDERFESVMGECVI
jgi:hypothetical protein